MPARHAADRPRPPRTLAVVLAVVIAAASSATALAASVPAQTPVSSAAAESGPVQRGVGVPIAHGTDWVGQYRVTIGGRAVDAYCIDPTRRQPRRLTLTTTRRVPGLSTIATREIAQVLTAHGRTERRVQAEATSQAVNYLAGNRAAVTRRARYLAPSTQRLAMAYVAQARQQRGDVRVTLRLPRAALPGQSGRATVTVRGAGGGVPVAVSLTHSGNVATPRGVRTDARGQATFPYTTTGSGPVHVAASVTGLAPATVRVSHPSAGYQHLVSASPSTSGHASAGDQGRVGGFTGSYRCSSECAGHPVVTLRACGPGSAYASRLVFAWAGGSRSLGFAAGRRACRALDVTLADGLRVTARWQYRTPRGWSAGTAAGGSFVVDCPAAPPVAVALSFDCAAASVTAVLGRQRDGRFVALHNSTGRPMLLTVTGAVSGSYPLAPGATAEPHSWALACGSHARVSVRSGVQRRDGRWNYGRPATVTAP